LRNSSVHFHSLDPNIQQNQKYCEQMYHYMSIVSSLRGKIGIHFSYLDLSVNLSNSKNHRFLTEF
jgi:hypothetical protein